MNTANRTPRGRFAPGTSGNPKGRPTDDQRARLTVEQTLMNLGATADEIEMVKRAASNKLTAAAALAVMVAAVTLRREDGDAAA
ncbi:MAG: DUF5681 domain-containing protein [Desulfovibrionaceae bacterium]|nr:DUF5681 domain-containing protein [Desulfovibrionaceae bacterium]